MVCLLLSNKVGCGFLKTSQTKLLRKVETRSLVSPKVLGGVKFLLLRGGHRAVIGLLTQSGQGWRRIHRQKTHLAQVTALLGVTQHSAHAKLLI